MEELIRLEEIGVRYDVHGHAPKQVLDQVELTICRGEFVAVCGETGCGKSTMLRLILGAEPHTRPRAH
jgi:ABC-type nitrate/sulfonate/bicarbonate transport system ATPase subunit